MKVLLDIPDSKSAISILEMVKKYASVKATKLSAHDAAILQEIKHIKEAHKLAKQFEEGKIKSRPVSELLHEL